MPHIPNSSRDVKPTNVRIPTDLKAALERIAKTEGSTLHNLALRAVQKYAIEALDLDPAIAYPVNAPRVVGAVRTRKTRSTSRLLKEIDQSRAELEKITGVSDAQRPTTPKRLPSAKPFKAHPKPTRKK